MGGLVYRPAARDKACVRVVLASFGTQGDVGPFLRLAQVLEARGHETFSVTDRVHAGRLAAAGVPGATPIARYDARTLLEDPRYSNPHTGAVHVFRDIFVPLVAEMYAATQAALTPDTDLVLVHPWCFGAHYAAEAAGLAAGTMCLSPITWWSVADPGLYSHLRPPRWLHKALLRGPTRWLLNTFFGRHLHRARAALGLPRTPRPFFGLYQVGVNYALWPQVLRGPAADDPHQARIVGFEPPGHEAQPLDSSVQDFLQAGEAPVVLGLGSLLPPLAPEIYEATKAAARALGKRVVLVGGPEGLADDDTLVVERAPYPALFAQAQVVLHHGGINTLSEALRAGRPQLVIPFATDQFDNGWRVERLGVAGWLPRAKVTPKRLTALLGRVLEDGGMAERAQALGAELRAAPAGTAVIAEDLERRFAGRPKGT